MKVALLIISILLIVLVLLQSGNAERTSGIFSGDTSSLFVNRKERGSELFMTRFTFILGIAFFLICLIAMFV